MILIGCDERGLSGGRNDATLPHVLLHRQDRLVFPDAFECAGDGGARRVVAHADKAHAVGATVDDGTPVTGIVVIGGTYDTEATNVHGQMALNETGERLIALGELARRYPEAKLIYAGGGSEFTPDTTPEATLVENTAHQLGVARERILYDRRSLNTFQNALYAKELAEPKAGERWLVVTSAFHMPRTMGVFRKVGFEVVPYPVDYRTAGAASLARPFAFVGEGLRRTDVATKEWIGLLSYYLTDKTPEVFPAP